MSNKIKFISSAFIVVLVGGLFFVFSKNIVSSKNNSINNNNNTEVSSSEQLRLGELNVQVVDGFTDLPISDAIIVVPELQKQFKSDKNGLVNIPKIPIIQNKNFSNILSQQWGEITLLVYKDEYLPYALFYAQVNANQPRNGPKIYLFKSSESTEKQPLGIIEGPQKEWINKLVEKYNPKK